MNQNDYVKLSLELHLFFDRIMKEHSFFLETSFTEKNNEFKRIANEFQKAFSDILEDIINLSDGQVDRNFIVSNEIVTDNTLEAERKSSDLSGVRINTNITEREMNLRGGRINLNQQLIDSISNINRQTLPILEQLIEFKTDILNDVVTCKMYTTNYPLLIEHILNEAKMYYNLLNRVENRQILTNNYIYEQELFWNNIMKEHAEFIRGLLDPSEQQLILTSNKFAEEYKSILENYRNNYEYLTNISLAETLKFKDFKVAGEEGILNCKIKSIIIPLLADHVVREANHFIRILRNYKDT